MGDEFFSVVRKKENSTDCCALEAPLFLVGKGKDKAAGDKQKSNQLIHPPLALGWASDMDLEPPNLRLQKPWPSHTDWAHPSSGLATLPAPKAPKLSLKKPPRASARSAPGVGAVLWEAGPADEKLLRGHSPNCGKFFSLLVWNLVKFEAS